MLAELHFQSCSQLEGQLTDSVAMVLNLVCFASTRAKRANQYQSPSMTGRLYLISLYSDSPYNSLKHKSLARRMYMYKFQFKYY